MWLLLGSLSTGMAYADLSKTNLKLTLYNNLVYVKVL